MIPLLSVCCTTYNHEPYLRKALDGIFNQKTNFDFEIIVGEDCSTDGSRKILQEYEEKHPNRMQVLYREKNFGAKMNFRDVFSRAYGKYVIVLETDDYWTDEYKLQKQVDFLESHPDVIAVSHQCVMVDANGDQLPMEYPSIKGGYFTAKDIRKGLFPGQTTTVMYRNYHNYPLINTTLIYSDIKGPGDKRKNFSLLGHGKIYCMPEKMSAYRFVTSGGNSFSANHKADYHLTMLYYHEWQAYAHKNFTDKEILYTADYLALHTTVSAFLHKKAKLADVFQVLKKSNRKCRALLLVISKYIVRPFQLIKKAISK